MMEMQVFDASLTRFDERGIAVLVQGSNVSNCSKLPPLATEVGNNLPAVIEHPLMCQVTGV